ncbi:MAG: TrpB-like pyridoxal phosphate-dependent enzyme [Thermoplasmatales archaeon]|nr:TrpB-like pyridoxal phosphate-dependent enzyme [Thermoplasmatales archaeon]
MNPPKDARIDMPAESIPRKWYNFAADLPEPLEPMLNPKTREPIRKEDMEALFCKEIIKQEFSLERHVDIPAEVRDNYVTLCRPTPLQRAYHLERELGTPAKIFFKREDIGPLGSHKGNSALAQAYYNAKAGMEALTTETGAGQWGSALALACKIFGLGCTVFMVRNSYEAKPYRKTVMGIYGADVHSSPSKATEYGKRVLAENPDTNGSLGIAISEACELAAGNPKVKYALGSVLNHVMLHQTVIGLETIEQMKAADIVPDKAIACVGGGSNFAGFCFPMMREYGRDCQFIAAESSATPSLTKGERRYDYGDTGCMTPMMMMYTMGHEFMPSGIHAGGLRYHGMSPLVSEAYRHGMCSAVAYDQTETFEAGMMFANAEGIIPAPESCHAIKAAIDCALAAKRESREETIVFNLSGHGLIDLYGYQQYMDGKL